MLNRKSLLWRIVHSWWILLTLIFFLYWSAFFYIAMRVRSKSFAIWGVVYAVTCFGGLTLISPNEQESWQMNLGVPILLISWIISIIHTFKVRKEYLLRLEARQLSSIREENELKHKIEDEYGVDFNLNTTEPEHSKRALPQTIPAKGNLIRQSSHSK